MKVTCESCKTVIKVPDKKVKSGKPLSFKCPNCKKSVTANSPGYDETRNIPIPPAPGPVDPASIEKILDSMESDMDMLGDSSKRALIADVENSDRLMPVLKKLEYSISLVSNTADAIRKLQYNFYDLVIIHENFDCDELSNNQLLGHIKPMEMDTRRRMFVTLIGKSFKTFDNMEAFMSSANLVVNESDFSNFELILKKALKDNNSFYSVFKKTLVETGKELEEW